jgi:CheY-like chemotaxis protein
VQQILAFSRKSDEDKQPLELRKIIHEAIEMLRSTLPTTIDIQTTIASDAWVMGNVIQMHQVLMNLCTNASHAMREKGGVLGINVCDVTVTAENVRLYHELPPGPYVKLSVSDTGTGIAPEFINRVFEPFFTTKGVGEGSGMGLSVVYGIVKDQGGDITVESELGKGTTFQVLLPRIESKGNEEETIGQPVPKGTERVLLVDDEEVIIDVGQKLLEMLGYQVTATSSSAEALEIFQKEPEKFDLVITDYTMPHMTGYELAKRLMDTRPNILIILCTGYNESISPDKAKTLGIREFIMKPLDLRLMGEVIRKVLDNKSA